MERNKFQKMKTIVDDINNMLVELKDVGVSMRVEPSNDIDIKMASISDSHFYIDFINIWEPWPEMRDIYPLIFEKIHMIIEYLDEKGFYTEVSSKTYSKQSYERSITIEELESNLENIPAYRLSFIHLQFFRNKIDESAKIDNMKSIISNINNMLVELKDEDVLCDLEPSIDNEVRIKEDIFISFYPPHNKLRFYNLIIEKTIMISEYLSEKGYSTKLNVKYYHRYPDGRAGRIVSSNITPLELEKLYDHQCELTKRYKENGIMYINIIQLDFVKIDKVNESLPNQKSIDQLKRVMKLSAKTDIGNRISDMNKQGANIHYIQNPIDNGIESREDYDKHNKSYIPSWNLKHLLSPFQHAKKNKKK